MGSCTYCTQKGNSNGAVTPAVDEFEDTLRSSLVSNGWAIHGAGSERVGKSEATGERLEEAKHINRSLSALGDVMAALAARDAKHVPFRNSKLTQLLQDSLCGQAKAMMFIHIAPEARTHLKRKHRPFAVPGAQFGG